MLFSGRVRANLAETVLVQAAVSSHENEFNFLGPDIWAFAAQELFLDRIDRRHIDMVICRHLWAVDKTRAWM